MIRMLTVALTALMLIAPAAIAAPAITTQQIENWHDEGIVFVVRDAEGHIIAHAKGHLERWTSETQQVWVVRDAQGRFMTFAHGKVETWTDGSKRIVLRNKDGKFIAVGWARVTTHGIVEETHPEDALKVLAVF
jgi:hypothetical protein